MTRYVLDCCTLLNLHCGWGGIQNLADFGQEWCIGESALAEAKYVREFEANGVFSDRHITPAHLLNQFPLSRLTVASEKEADLLVKLSAILDDGEAEGLTLAASRGMTFCSDDAPVHAATRSLGLTAPIVSTPELLEAWAGNNPATQAQLPAIVRRITDLSRFAPHRASPHLLWWNKQLATLKP